MFKIFKYRHLKSLLKVSTAKKVSRIRGYFGPYFPAFGLNTDQNNSKYGHFLRNDLHINVYLITLTPINES